MRDALNMKRVRGVQADVNYTQIKSVIMNNKMKTHEMEENKKIEKVRGPRFTVLKVDELEPDFDLEKILKEIEDAPILKIHYYCYNDKS